MPETFSIDDEQLKKLDQWMASKPYKYTGAIQSESPSDSMEKLAKAFENMADEIRSGGGIPIGRDGEQA